MTNFKNFGILGVGSSIQLGKAGGNLIYGLVSDGSVSGTSPAFLLKDSQQSNLIRVQAASPVHYNDLTTKLYVDNLVQGLNIKNSVKVATSGTNVSLTGSTPLTIDGVQLQSGDRVLIKDQTTQTQNGLYVVTVSGSNYSLNRSADASNTSDSGATSSTLTGGSFVFVTAGSVNADTGWVLSSPDGPVNIGTDNITWTQFSSAGIIQSGSGLSKSGNILSVNADNSTLYVNQTTSKLSIKSGSVTGNILLSNGSNTDATWGKIDLTNANTVGTSVLGIANGGTGLSSFKAGDILTGTSTGLQSLSIGATNTYLGVGSSNALSYSYITQLRDTSGNTTLQSAGVSSPVNFLTAANSAAGNSSVIGTSGSDTNIGISFSPKGTGLLTTKPGYDANLQSVFSSLTDEALITRGTLNKRVSSISTSSISNAVLSSAGTITTAADTFVSTNTSGYTSEILLVSNNKSIAEFQSSSTSGVATSGERLKVTNTTGEIQLSAVDNSGTANVNLRLLSQGSGVVAIGNSGSGLIQTDPGFNLDIRGGNSSTTVASGNLTLAGGSAISNNLKGGNVVIRGGLANGTGSNGEVFIQDYNQQNIVEFTAPSTSSTSANWLQIFNSPDSTNAITSGILIQPAPASITANISLILGVKGTGLVRVPNASAYNANLSSSTPDALVTVGYLSSTVSAAAISAGSGLVNQSNTFKLATGATTITTDTSGNAIVNSSGTKNQLLLSSGTTGKEAIWSSLPLADSNAVSGVLPVVNGGTGLQSFNNGDLLIGNSSKTVSSLPIDTVNKILSSTGTVPSWQYLSTLRDTNGNIAIGTSATASAVNYLSVINAAASSSPIVGVSGSDTNISLTLQAKGTGLIVVPSSYNSSLVSGASSLPDNTLVTKGYVSSVIPTSVDSGARLISISSGWSSVMNIGSVLPAVTGRTTVVTSVKLTVATAVTGNSVYEANIIAGSTILMDISECDITAPNTYVSETLLPNSLSGNQVSVQFFAADGSTAVTPTAGNITILVNYKVI